MESNSFISTSFTCSDPLLTDATLAEMLSVSLAWVRKQRYLRRKGEPHTLTVDPVLVGDMPRYRIQDINTWLAGL